MNEKNQKPHVDHFLQYLRKAYPSPEVHPTLPSIQQGLFRLKMVDAIWFDGLPAKTLHATFTYWVNDDFPNAWITPDNYSGIWAFNETEMVYFSHRLKRPLWVNKAPRYTYTASQIQANWGKLLEEDANRSNSEIDTTGDS